MMKSESEINKILKEILEYFGCQNWKTADSCQVLENDTLYYSCSKETNFFYVPHVFCSGSKFSIIGVDGKWRLVISDLIRIETRDGKHVNHLFKNDFEGNIHLLATEENKVLTIIGFSQNMFCGESCVSLF